MTSKICRTLLIESTSITDQTLLSIGKSVSETLRVAINRVTERPTITHFSAYLVDIQMTQLSRLLDIKSEQFIDECLPKLSLLKRPTKQMTDNQNSCDKIAKLLKDINESIDRSKEVNKTELTYVSGRDLEDVIDDFTFAFDGQHINSSFISQLNIVIIKSRTDPNVVFGSVSFDFTGISDELRALLEIQTIDNSLETIDGYFKVWLQHLNVDSERVRIYFNKRQTNGHLMNGQHMNGDTFVIKCDLREAVIDMNRLSIDKSGKKLNPRQISAKECLPNICETNSCYELEILGLISRLGLCESVLFGIPYILMATRSPDLEFNELKLNSNRFHALIQVLNEKNAVIIFKERQPIDTLINFFAVMPSSDSKTLIMKAVATKELVLPHLTDSYESITSEAPTQAVIQSIRSQLSAFQFADIYNPLQIETNLFDIL